ncbi:MAG: hypothetical protein Q7U75_11595 [Desulfobacterales bacterium]|nr:hypothetical protein [Desulfobacterales bacterium]
MQVEELVKPISIRVLPETGAHGDHGDKEEIDIATNHVLGDACTPGNPKECALERVRPVADHCLNGDLDELRS